MLLIYLLIMEKKPTIAIAPKKGEIASYLTKGKKYEIVKWITDNLFVITNENGKYILCYHGEEYGCSHLKGLKWALK